jgi:hypothetical protein
MHARSIEPSERCVGWVLTTIFCGTDFALVAVFGPQSKSVCT